MSFDDNENKVNNDDPIYSFFSEEELEESAKAYQNNNHAEDGKRRRPPEHTGDLPRRAESLREPLRRPDDGKARRKHRPAFRIEYIGQDKIQPAANELTKNAVINDTAKVRKRAAKTERLGLDGTTEPDYTGTVSVMSDDPAPVEDYKQQPAGLHGAGRFARNALNTAAGVFRHDKDGIRNRNIEMYDTENYARKMNDGRKRKQRKKKGPAGVIIRLVLLVIFIVLCIVGYSTANKVCNDKPMNPSDNSKIQISITADSTDSSVGEFLVKNKLVESKLIYKIRAKLFEANYKEGIYEISPSYTTEKIIDIISGYTVKTEK